MLIDWFTVGTQTFNFLILVWLMKRFLYQPILKSVDAREQRIANQIADAKSLQLVAEKKCEEFLVKNQTFDELRTAMLNEAAQAAQTEAQRLLEEARLKADTLSSQRLEALKNEIQNLNQTLQSKIQQEVLAITRKVLIDLATSDLEEHIVAVFVRRLQKMDSEAKETLAEAIAGASEPGLIRSCFELHAEQRAMLQKALNATFATEIQIRFETHSDLIGGIELSMNGQKLAWNIAEYLLDMEKEVTKLLAEHDKSAIKSDTEPPIINA